MKKMAKTLLTAMLVGAATSIGSIIVTKGAERISNPVWRANTKRLFTSIKKKLFKKGS